SNLVPGDTNQASDVFVYDRVTSQLELISISVTVGIGNGQSRFPAISADGRFVAFLSFASNLIRTDRNSRPDIFVRDRLLGTTTRVSVSSSGTQSTSNVGPPAISPNGLVVAF